LELSQFATRELEKAYGNLASFSSLRTVEGGKALPLLRDHLLERNQAIQETVLRVLAVQDAGEQMQVILKALRTKDKRDVDNAIEALESTLHSGIRKVLIPLLEQIPMEEKLARGRKHLRVALDGNAPPEITLLDRLTDDDPVTQALALYALCEMTAATIPVNEVRPWLESNDPLVRDAALSLLQSREGGEPAPGPAGDGVPFIDKVLQMRRVPMFAHLHVRELMAIATIAVETRWSRGDAVVREGDQGDGLFLVFEGDLSVVKGWQSGHDVALARIGANDFFGEMALFDREPRSASVLAETDATLLKIEEEAFDRLMKHYPAIPINICLAFSQRMRSLQERLRQTRGEAAEAGSM
jgi:CRP-like cAMP-binding protein